MRENRYAYFDAFGAPEEVLQVGKGEMRMPAAGEVCVRMLAAPINPADINYVQGVYGEVPELPATRVGLEGCGVVHASAAEGFAAGDMVILLNTVGAWSRFLTAPAASFLRLEERLDPMQAAMLKVNPLTALRVLEDYTPLQEGDWLVMNAANSGVGQCLIQLARERGLHTICVVRQAETRRATLQALGADIVADEEEPDMVRRVLATPGVKRPRLAANCVGGESALRLMDMLAPGGTMVTFGSMSRKSIKVPNSWLIFKDISLRGLWCTKWLQQAPAPTVAAAYHSLAKLVAAGKLQQRVAAVYGPDALPEACRQARQEGRNGKIILRFGE